MFEVRRNPRAKGARRKVQGGRTWPTHLTQEAFAGQARKLRGEKLRDRARVEAWVAEFVDLGAHELPQGDKEIVVCSHAGLHVLPVGKRHGELNVLVRLQFAAASANQDELLIEVIVVRPVVELVTP